VSAAGWGAIAFTSLVCTAGAYLLNTRALQQLSASRVALIQNVEPLVAVTAAALLLSEAVTAAMLAGGAAILGGVYLAERVAPLGAAAPRPQATAAGD
jgi:drug/metabolite transporter (DMT)-like permease